MKTEATQTQTSRQRVVVRNILVLTDFSPRSGQALKYAAGWARTLGAKLHVANFIRPASYAIAWDAYGPVMEKVWEEARADLAAIDASAELRDVPHQTHLDPGEVLDGLPQLIAAQKVDLVVMASSARRGLEKALLGSTAEAVFRHVTVPVLMLGPNATVREQPMEKPTVLLATDFGPATQRATALAFSMVQELEAHLTMLHVLPTILSGEKGLQLVESEDAERRLRALVPPGAEDWCETTPVVKTGEVAEEVVKTAQEVHADMIVLGTRRPPRVALYTGWANAYRVLHEAKCPVLTVRE